MRVSLRIIRGPMTNEMTSAVMQASTARRVMYWKTLNARTVSGEQRLQPQEHQYPPSGAAPVSAATTRSMRMKREPLTSTGHAEAL